MKIKAYIFSVLLLISALSFSSCDNGVNLFSLSDDVNLGKQLNGEVLQDNADYPVFKGNPNIKSYINSRIFNHILASSQIENKNTFTYTLEIIDKDSILNAFTLPGGYIYVYTGLLKYLDSEASLAGVLGHEIAHAERRHSTKRMTAQYGVEVLLNMVLGNNPSELEQIAANLFVGLGLLYNSRSDENEADDYSFKYLKDTRYYPGGVKFFFEKMRDEGLIASEPNKIQTFLSTHPDPIDRITSINQKVSNAGLTNKTWKDNGTDICKTEYQTNIKGLFK